MEKSTSTTSATSKSNSENTNKNVEKNNTNNTSNNNTDNPNNNRNNNNKNRNHRNRNRNSGNKPKNTTTNDNNTNTNKNDNTNNNNNNNNNNNKNKNKEKENNTNSKNVTKSSTNSNNNSSTDLANSNTNASTSSTDAKKNRNYRRRQKQKAKEGSKEGQNTNTNNNTNNNNNNNNGNKAKKSRSHDNIKRAEKEKEKERKEDDEEEEEEREEEEEEELVEQTTAVPIQIPLQPILVMCPFTDCKQENSPFMNPGDLQQHLGAQHHIKINNIEHVVPFIEKYLNYWIDKIENSNNQLEKFGTKVKNSNIYSIPNKACYKEDISVRQEFQREKLNEMLMIQDRERKDTNKPRKCLFCKKVVEERINYFQHMFTEHNFNIGLPDNIVNVDEFLYILQTKLNNLQCLYCEKIFKSNAVLRKHMRKKKHFKINSKNHIYDKFYIINYLEPGKNWENFVNDHYESDEEKDDEWDDWDDEVENEPTMCLFDEYVANSIEEALNHMKQEHQFDFYEIQKKNGLDFYQCIMLINYIRRQTSLLTCFSCLESFDNMEALGEHMKTKQHYTMIPPKDKENGWNDVKYMLPTYDDDPLLHGFDEFFEDLSDTEQKDISTQYVTAEKLSIDDRLKAKQRQEQAQRKE